MAIGKRPPEAGVAGFLLPDGTILHDAVVLHSYWFWVGLLLVMIGFLLQLKLSKNNFNLERNFNKIT